MLLLNSWTYITLCQKQFLYNHFFCKYSPKSVPSNCGDGNVEKILYPKYSFKSTINYSTWKKDGKIKNI